jgi:hypothetical protein
MDLEFIYCTSERICVKHLQKLGCIKTSSQPEYLHDLDNPNSWSYLEHYDNHVISHPIGREFEVEEKYEKNKKTSVVNDVIDNIKSKLLTQWFVLRDNDYPYHVPDNVKHMIYWHDGSHSRKVAKENVHTHMGVNMEDVVVFTNSPTMQTIPEIAHHHVFVRDSREKL